MLSRIIVCCLLFFKCLIVCIAQPNPGFENWHSELSYLVPDNWQTFNILSVTSPPNPLSAFRVTGIDVHSGNYALQLKTVYFNNFNMPPGFGDTAGGAFTGHINYSPFNINYGFPYTSRPEFFEFWGRYLPVGNDTGVAIVFFTKWNGVKSDTIGFCYQYLFNQPTYNYYKDTITYLSDQIPDTAAIIFVTSKSMASARINSVMYVDDVALTGWVGIKEYDKLKEKVKLFPNPAKEFISMQFDFDEDIDEIKIVDLQGKLIEQEKIINNKIIVNTAMYENGCYLFAVYNRDKKIIYQNKFNVVK